MAALLCPSEGEGTLTYRRGVGPSLTTGIQRERAPAPLILTQHRLPGRWKFSHRGAAKQRDTRPAGASPRRGLPASTCGFTAFRLRRYIECQPPKSMLGDAPDCVRSPRRHAGSMYWRGSYGSTRAATLRRLPRCTQHHCLARVASITILTPTDAPSFTQTYLSSDRSVA